MTEADVALEVTGVSVKFGGLTALEGVSLQAPMGAITGLIGSNGAGKSTTFNVCTGLVKPVSGTVRMFGKDVTHLSPSDRAAAGLARTFQRVMLYDGFTVRENVRMGLEAAVAGRGLRAKVWASRAELEQIHDVAEAELARCGLVGLADRPAASLSTGQKRLVELARALASPARLLLLDEPSSGLDNAETERFGDILLEVLEAREVAVLLVEHDIDLVARTCSHAYALEFGRLICEGPVQVVLNSDEVRAAYLGSAAV